MNPKTCPKCKGKNTYYVGENKFYCKDCEDEWRAEGMLREKTLDYKKEAIKSLEEEKTLSELREKLAELEHEQWAHWTKYFLENLTDENIGRWKQQINTKYKDLSEKEKESDRKWADKGLKIINEWKKQFIKEILEEIEKFKDECRVFGVDGEDDKYNEDYDINCRGVLKGLEELKQIIKQKDGEGLI